MAKGAQCTELGRPTMSDEQKIQDLEDRIANLETFIHTIASVLMDESSPCGQDMIFSAGEQHYFAIKSYTGRDPNTVFLNKRNNSIED